MAVAAAVEGRHKEISGAKRASRRCALAWACENLGGGAQASHPAALHLLYHGLALLLAGSLLVFVLSELLNHRLAVRLPFLSQFHQVAGGLGADLLQLLDVLRRIRKHLERVSLDLILLLQRIRSGIQRRQVRLNLPRLRSQNLQISVLLCQDRLPSLKSLLEGRDLRIPRSLRSK